jgi:hypothetical protein
MFLKTSFFLVVSTRAYLVISTYSGFSSVVAIDVESKAFKIIQNTDGPAK